MVDKVEPSPETVFTGAAPMLMNCFLIKPQLHSSCTSHSVAASVAVEMTDVPGGRAQARMALVDQEELVGQAVLISAGL